MSLTSWEGSGGRTPKPSSPDHRMLPSKLASPPGEVARTHAEVSSIDVSFQSSHGSCWGRPSSSTTSSGLP